MIVANTKGRVSTLAVDDNLRMGGKTIEDVGSVVVNEHVTLVGAQRLPGKGFRSTERNGWGVSKDNGDIERKFWKDDFSVDSSDQYTGSVASFTWDTVNAEITSTDGVPYKRIKYIEPISDSVLGAKISFSLKCSEVTGYRGGVILGYIGSTPYTLNVVADATRVSMFIRTGSSPLDYVSRLSSTATFDTNYHNYVLIINHDGTCEGWFDGVKGNPSSFVLPTGMNLTPGIVTDVADGKTICWKDVTYTPSISYSDDFATDTVSGANGRYQAVTGTVAYDDVNKQMNVITATGANGKASGRLKSYKFTEGSQIFDVTLPTGADGDFITLVTHSANGLMTDGIGVGLQSDGAGNWNLATLSNTKVTGGASSGLVDGKTARIEIEKDLTGAYWYYIYDAAGAKPTNATGKLFTTLTEGYTGWYANGAGATTQTFAIDNISIRAESIVGRTNVEVEEPFWLRDEFNEDSIGRYLGYHESYTASDGRLKTGVSGHFIVVPVKLLDPTIEITWNPTSKDASDRYRFAIGFRTNDRGISNLFNSSSVDPRYILYFFAENNSVQLWKYDGISMIQDIDIKSIPVVFNTDNIIRISKIGKTFEVTIGVNTVTLTDTTASNDIGASYPVIENEIVGSIPHEFDNLQITGTRVYNKPIHRGAMLETYHDGTQEVVGTTFIDDYQWDRLNEWAVVGSNTVYDTVNGRLDCAHITNSGVYTKQQFTDGYISVNVKIPVVISATAKIILRSAVNDSQTESSGNKYQVSITSNRLSLIKVYDGGSTILTYYTFEPISGVTYNLIVVFIGPYIKVYLDGILRISVTDHTYASGYIGFGKYHPSSSVYFSDIQIIAAESSSTNGIAACIPPIGGGARYGEVEEVYHEYTNEVRKGKYLVSTCVKTTNADAEAIEMYLENTTDSTAITEDASKTVAIALADTNYMDVEKEIKLGYADRGDTLKVAVRKTSAATEVSPACFVEMLNVTPSVEVI